jgi:hypothetical protein
MPLPRSRWIVVTLLGVVAALNCGCGEKPRTVAHLSGSVTLNGKPVPAGFINFLPDVTAGNSGEVKAFPIIDGKYNTAEGSNPGIYPGVNKVMISGFDGKPSGDLWPKGKQIFNPIDLMETVPDGTTTKDFVIPPSAAQNVRIVPTGDPK